MLTAPREPGSSHANPFYDPLEGASQPPTSPLYPTTSGNQTRRRDRRGQRGLIKSDVKAMAIAAIKVDLMLLASNSRKMGTATQQPQSEASGKHRRTTDSGRSTNPFAHKAAANPH